MIFEALFTLISVLLQSVLGILPDLPAVSTSISDAGDWIIDIVGSVMFVPFHLLGVSFTLAMFGALVLLIAFDQIYHTVMWILRKLPIGVN